MSLIKKHEMTEKKLAANRQNQKLSHGPVTDEGRERIRAAHLRHGFYAQAEEVALRALGEDPAQFQELVEGLWEEWNPAGSMQEGLVIRLARATWLMNRADRMQEGYAVRQAQDVSSGRRGPAARADDAPEDDGGKIAPARPIGGARALRHHSRRPGEDEKLAPGGGVEGDGRNRAGPLLPTSAAGQRMRR